ncbi:hypothetical protein ABK040_014785 [Willaertia magna]
MSKQKEGTSLKIKDDSRKEIDHLKELLNLKAKEITTLQTALKENKEKHSGVNNDIIMRNAKLERAYKELEMQKKEVEKQNYKLRETIASLKGKIEVYEKLLNVNAQTTVAVSTSDSSQPLIMNCNNEGNNINNIEKEVEIPPPLSEASSIAKTPSKQGLPKRKSGEKKFQMKIANYIKKYIPSPKQTVRSQKKLAFHIVPVDNDTDEDETLIG